MRFSFNGGSFQNPLSRREFLGTAATALAAVAAAAMGGCGRSDQARERRTADGRIQVNFWNGFTGPDGKAMEALVRAFEQANPDVAVAMQIIPWGTYYDKLTLSLAYGGAPDVFVVHATRLPEFASFDVLRPLSELFASDGAQALKESDFAPVPWRATFYQDTQYALPLDVHPQGLYYNLDLFEKAGIAGPPRTGEEFLDTARRLTQDTNKDGRPDQWGFVYTWQRTNFLTMAPQFGGGILSPDLQRILMDTPETLEAARWMRSTIYEHRVAPRPEGVDAWLAFRQGKVGMALEGVYMLSSLEEQEGLRYAAAPVPQFGPKQAVWGGSHLLAQPANTRGNVRTDAQARATWRLMRYISDHSLTWAKGGQVPARLSVLKSPEFQALPVQSAIARQLDYVVYEPLTPKSNALMPFVDPAVEAILLDLQTPEAALKDSARRVEQVLRRP